MFLNTNKIYYKNFRLQIINFKMPLTGRIFFSVEDEAYLKSLYVNMNGEIVDGRA